MLTIWQNTQNEHKYLEVVHYKDGHYFIHEYMQWGSVRNSIGRRRMVKIHKRELVELLKDYKKVS